MTPQLEPPGLLHEVPCGILSFADDGTVRFANETLLSMLGLSSGALVGKNVESVLTVSSRIFYQTHFFPLLSLHGRADEVFLSLKAADGSHVPVMANAVRRGGGAETISHCALVPIQQRQQYEEEILAARRRAEEALQSNRELIEARTQLKRHALELDRKLDQFQRQHRDLLRLTAVLSHDVREPIRKIGLFTSFLRSEIGADVAPQVEAVLGRLETAHRRADRLVQVLREYLSVDTEAGRKEEVDLKQALRAAESKLRDRTQIDDLQIVAGELPVVQGHQRQLVMLFHQLLDNAVKFRRPDVPLKVTVEGNLVQHNQFRASPERYRYVDYAQIVFSDNGRGFDMRYAEYVFEMLKQIDPGSPGLGIGLTLSRKIAENHHGAISAESVPGAGTRFTILLHRKDDPGESAAEALHVGE